MSVRPRSARVQLASLALASALGETGVAATDPGPGGIYSTGSGEEQLPGVVCTAASGGGYVVELHLIAHLVPLAALAERIRDQIEVVARGAGLREELHRIDVHFEDVTDASDALMSSVL